MYPSNANMAQVIGTYWDGGKVTGVLNSFSGFNDSRSNPIKNGVYREGHAWCMHKDEIVNTFGSDLKVYVTNSDLHYSGKFRIANDYRTTYQPNWAWTTRAGAQPLINALNNRGAEAWARCRPDLPDFSLATELMELRDLPRLFKTQIRRIKRLAWREYRKRHPRAKRYTSDYAQYHLELQFGWLPILSSILNYREVMKNKEKLLAQKIRDAGRPVRRRRELSDAEDRKSYAYSVVGNGYNPEHHPILNTNCYSGSSERSGYSSSKNKTWAVAQMRYFLPPGPRTIQWKENLWRRMRGGMITTDLIYNAMPWTWLADYFTDLGHFVQATSGGVGDRLAADYCYLMRTVDYEFYSHARLGLRKKGGGAQYTVLTRKRNVIWKIRIKATPFGFGLRQSDLSPIQLSILGALGLSKL